MQSAYGRTWIYGDNMLPLNCDWLALSLRLQDRPSGCPAGHKWAFYSPTNVWASRWCLYNDYGDKVFTLLFQPRQSIINAQAAVLEVSNEWLYHGLGQSGCLSLLAQVVTFQITGISRLDLAVDFNPDEAQADIIRGLSDGRFYVGGKRNGSGFWSTIKDDNLATRWQGRCPHCQSWGPKTSDVKWKLYYKTKELRDAVGGHGWDKPYIVDMWREAGLDVTDVWRLEVSVHNCNNFNFMGERLTYDRYLHQGDELFKALYTSRFQVSKNEGHKDKSNDERVEFLPVGALHDAFKVRRHDTLAEHNGRLTLIRHLCNDVQKEEVLLSDAAREAVIAAVGDVLENDRSHNYFQEVVGQGYDDWVEWLRVKAYYFGEEHLPSQDDGSIMEMAMLQAGLITDHSEENNPLGTPSSMSHGDQQLQLFATRDSGVGK